MFKKFNQNFLVLLLSYFIAASPAYAESAELRDLLAMDIEKLANIQVSVGSKRNEKIADSPGIISVVTKQEIESYGGLNLMDVLRRLPNLDINYVPLTPTGLGVNARGQTPSGPTSHTLLLIDGRPYRESQAGTWNLPMYLAFPLDIIERIEVIRGPGSVLYGTNAFSATVNVITKKPELGQIDSLKLESGYGAYNTYRTQASYGYYSDKHDISFSGATHYHNSDGWKYKLTDIANVYDDERLHNDNRGYYLRGHYKNLTLSAFQGSTKTQALGVVPAWPDGYNKVEREFLDIGYEQEIFKGWKANLNVTYNGFNNFATDGNVIADHNNFHDLFYEVSLMGKVGDKANLLLGTTYDDRRGTLKLGSTDFDEYILGHYVQGDYKPYSWLKLIAGVQFNKPEKEEAYDLSPRLGSIFYFNDKIGAKLLYGEAFRAPTGAEVSLNIPSVIGNTDLVSEKIRTKEAELFYINGNTQLSLSAYRSDILNTITIGPNPSAPPAFSYQNVGRLEYKGIEFEAKKRVKDDLDLQGSVSYQKGKNPETGNRDISNTPHFMFKLGGVYNYKNLVNLGVFNTYIADTVGYSASPTGKPNPELKNTNHLTANIRFNVNGLLDLPASYPEMSFSLYGDNLFDEDIRSRVTTAGVNANTIPINEGRAVYASFSVKF